MIPDDLTVCLMTCGEETEKDCLAAVYEGRSGGFFGWQEVRDVSPAARALNQMFAQCKTPYLIPLDADMVLYPDHLERIYGTVDGLKGDRSWHSILFPLWDTLTQEKILALKVFHMAVMREIPYKDDPCPDILHYQDMEASGLRCVNLYHEEPIGDHVVRGHYSCFAKYRDLYMVHRTHPQSFLPQHFKGGSNLKERAKSHYDFFVRRLHETGDKDYIYCVAGMVVGLTEPLRYTSKDLGDRHMPWPCGEAFQRFEEWRSKNKTDRIFM